MTYPKELLADHEAGHAIVALALGREITKLAIAETPEADGTFGRCVSEAERYPGDYRDYENMLLALGGIFGQQKRWPGKEWSAGSCSDGGDWMEARADAERLAGDINPDKFLMAGCVVVGRIIERFAADVEAISAALVEHGSLTHDLAFGLVSHELRAEFKRASEHRAQKIARH